MRVNVHPTRREQQAAGVDLVPRGAKISTDGGDVFTGDGHVPFEGGRAAAVDNPCVAYEQVVHERLP